VKQWPTLKGLVQVLKYKMNWTSSTSSLWQILVIRFPDEASCQ